MACPRSVITAFAVLAIVILKLECHPVTRAVRVVACYTLMALGCTLLLLWLTPVGGFSVCPWTPWIQPCVHKTLYEVWMPLLTPKFIWVVRLSTLLQQLQLFRLHMETLALSTEGVRIAERQGQRTHDAPV